MERRPGRRAGDGAALPGHPGGPVATGAVVRGEQAAAAAIDRLVAQTGGARGLLVGFVAGRIRALAGRRELPKFTIIRMMGVARTALTASGHDLVEAGLLDSPDDVFLLRLNEIEALADGPTPGLRQLVSHRRAAMKREAKRTQVPRVLVGDGRAFYEGLGDLSDEEGVIVGSPVSPGTVEGFVRVVLDPAHSGLRHGEILVCPGTDPAWTPLFLSAGRAGHRGRRDDDPRFGRRPRVRHPGRGRRP